MLTPRPDIDYGVRKRRIKAVVYAVIGLVLGLIVLTLAFGYWINHILE